MRAWLLPISLLITVTTVVGVVGLVFVKPAPSASLEAAEPPAWDAVGEVIEARQLELDAESPIPFGSDTQINILALGLDSRKEGLERHCDAIHLVTLDLSDWSILITSVPRGTYTSLPPGREYLETDYYVSNACAFGGLDYGIGQIEKIVGVKADYVATVGFSQALGIFRVLELPTTETLQWLRHRQSYAIGDPQRSQNQAVFMKDIALKLLGEDGISTALMHILYSLVDTDLDFKTTQALYTAYRAAEIANRPDDIALIMKPFYETREYHFDPDNAEVQIESLLASLEGRLSPQDLSHKSVEELQVELEKYLRESLASDETVVHVYDEQLWRQIEAEDTREELHFRFMEKYLREVKDTDLDKAIEIATDYILEKQYYGLTEWEQKGRDLLAILVVID
jgi:anionic cell wall polymer biosynthesis LytR-Cps2A-Psr (LCP) family protein